jgi:peroxiredoxin
MQRTEISEKFPLGSTLPDFSLPNVDGKTLSSDYLKDAIASVVVFTCNHCPYVKGSDQAMIALANDFQEKGIKFLAISSNDALQYPEDNFEKMQEKARDLNLPFPYLYDESQQIAKAFDAACTPECFVFDSAAKLVFHGTINNSPRHVAEVRDHYLQLALEQILAGKAPSPAFVHPIGCSIKWKVAS